jgi:poly(A) polymerase
MQSASIVTPATTPRIIPRSDHNISRQHISPSALRVLYRLRDAGFMAFLVGGCVRDLMIGIDPKDFDVATDALPEEVKRLFRNCRLVGRRFRLAHVFFGREIIEVATFRAATAPSPGEEPLPEPDVEEAGGDLEGGSSGVAELDDMGSDDADSDEVDSDETGDEDDDEDDDEADSDDLDSDDRAAPARNRLDDSDLHATPHGDAIGADLDVDPNAERMFDETGRILRDNVYGTIDADVWRRDLTCNALYYNIADFSVWDYVGGAEDIAARKLKLIGDPETRFREDPVRMLRAARFEAKLGFEIDPATAQPIERLRGLMGGVPPARLFDETLKLFLTGHGARSFEVLRQRGLLEALLPSVDEYFKLHPGSLVEKLLLRGLENTDSRVAVDKPVTPTFLFALLLYGPIASIIEATPPDRWHELSTILDACDQAAREVQTHISFPKRFSLGVREMFALQPRLEHPRGRRALRALEHPRFRAAYDLLLLRVEQGLASREMAEWWTRIQEVSPEERGRMADELTGQGPRSEGARRGGRRRRRHRGPSNQS